MLGALKFVPRDEVDLHADEKETTRARSSKRKHNHGKDYRKGASKETEKRKKKRARSSDSDGTGESGGTSQDSDREAEASSLDLKEDAKTRRAEAGLGWMMNAPDRPLGSRGQPAEEGAKIDFEEGGHEKPESNVRELNPYLTNAETGQQKVQKTTVPAGVGDGGASWRLKALKRAQEQAAREGRKLDEVVEERWGSLGTLTSSVAIARSAHANAHLHSIRNRKSRIDDNGVGRSADFGKESERSSFRGPRGEGTDRDSHKEHGSKMRVPHMDSNLSWKSSKKFEKNQPLRDADAAIVRSAATTFNKYASDGSFMRSFDNTVQGVKGRAAADTVSEKVPEGSGSPTDTLDIVYEPKRLFPTVSIDPESSSSDEAEAQTGRPAKAPENNAGEDYKSTGLSANQVAAKAMRLRLSGKTKEADELLREFEVGSRGASSTKGPSTIQRSSPTRAPEEQLRQRTSQGLGASSLRAQDSLRARNQSHDAEMAQTIARNKSYRGDETDEYDDYGNGLETQKIHARVGNMKKSSDKSSKPFRPFTTRQESCQFCFENPRRPKHLVIAIANFTYLMLPLGAWLVPDHCYIVPMQHDGASRNVDEDVWQELRNFKKCLVQMFAKCQKKVLFLETVMGLARQKRHFYIECIPIPNDTRATDAPLYFKKAIDEAEDEWSQHNAKKLIDTKQRGLRNSIPKNFPYFHVEFGLEGGYCHVIDDESKFDPNFGREVVASIIGEEEKMSLARAGSLEQQRARVDQFLKNWKEFDWTKMLD